MTEAQAVEIMVIISSILQAVVVVLAMVAISHVQNRKAWMWFIMASLVVFMRRLTAHYELLYGFSTNIIEGIETCAISIMWILFILVRTDNLTSKYNSQGDENGYRKGNTNKVTDCRSNH